MERLGDGGTRISLHHGDITTLAIEAIVNAANETGLGCFTPGHPCIDNAIHRAAGHGLTRECARIMTGRRLAPGQLIVTAGHGLTCRRVLHVLGPKADGGPPRMDLLAACYRNCLDVCAASGIRELAFCCISTGMYGFPKRQSADVAVRTVREWVRTHPGALRRIVFCVFDTESRDIYADRGLLP